MGGVRIKSHLKQIDTPFVMSILDDHFCSKEIDGDEIKKVVDMMSSDDRIAVCYLADRVDGVHRSKSHPGYKVMEKNAEQKFTTGEAIWRRDKWIQFIRDHETPWQYESYGSARCKRYNDLFYTCNKDLYPLMDIVEYGLIQGKWGRKTPELFCEYGVTDIDYSKRGFLMASRSVFVMGEYIA